MQGSSRTHALTHPPFTADRFVPGQWGTAQQKADFANALCRFIAEDFPRSRWKKPLYRRLHQTYGLIACYDLEDFWGAHFASLTSRVEFLEHLQTFRCYGLPEYTYCDVERAVQAWLRACDVLGAYRARLAQEVERRERAQLAALQAKYSTPAPGRPEDVQASPLPCRGGPEPLPLQSFASQHGGVGPLGAARPRRRTALAGQQSLL